MITFDDMKEFDVTALGRDAPDSDGKPRELPVGKIFPDPDNIRTDCEASTIAELAETIRADGLLQAITVRRHPDVSGGYLISYGERRWRAVRLLGLATIAAVIDEEFDPYRQAIENLQREELTPLQIAQFVAKREAAGDSRTTIAKRLGKSKSFISELARLASAPETVRHAVEGARIDTRTAYLLARHYPAHPEKVDALLSGSAPLNRVEVARELYESTGPTVGQPAMPRTPPRPRRQDYNALAVLVGGRTGILTFTQGASSNKATVQFADGSQETAALSSISLKHWVRL